MNEGPKKNSKSEMDPTSREFNDFIKPLGVDMEKVTRLSNSDNSVTSSEGFSISEDARIHAKEAVDLLHFFSKRMNYSHNGEYLLWRLRDISSSKVELDLVKRRAENLIEHLEWLFGKREDVRKDQEIRVILNLLKNY